jgi:hypothetical protein
MRQCLLREGDLRMCAHERRLARALLRARVRVCQRASVRACERAYASPRSPNLRACVCAGAGWGPDQLDRRASQAWDRGPLLPLPYRGSGALSWIQSRKSGGAITGVSGCADRAAIAARNAADAARKSRSSANAPPPRRLAALSTAPQLRRPVTQRMSCSFRIRVQHCFSLAI